MRKHMIYKLLTAGMALTLSLGAVMVSQAAWEKAPGGRWWYSYDSEGYAKGWAQIDGIWYYFDTDGWMKTGWLEDQGKWYYLDPISGSMTMDQWVDGYYINGDGVMEENDQSDTINSETVFGLLRKALSKEGLYPNAVMKIDHENGKEIVVNIGEENTPSQFKIYNRYTVNRATGEAVSDFTGPVLHLK